MLGVDVHIPQSGQQVGALQVDHPVTGRAGRRAGVTHIEDAAVFDDNGGLGLGVGIHAVDDIAVG